MRGRFGLPRSADHFVPSRAMWKQFGFGSQAFCFFGKSFFKCLDLFETAAMHDTTSVLTGPNRRVCTSNPNMPSAAVCSQCENEKPDRAVTAP
jgi:hypothetical protein